MNARRFWLHSCEWCGEAIPDSDWRILIWDPLYPDVVLVCCQSCRQSSDRYEGEVCLWLREKEAYLIRFPPNWSSYSDSKRCKPKRFAAFWRVVWRVLTAPLALWFLLKGE
jgi:hypothetical protein